ncbi:hypothetical protein LSTR_LSTR002561 [Laodelphax striatellus]|uniref:Non-homologous end-joining factor 1 n=1 Tax=Laodelphax striatellus TaxID=195883 RepID=A0A482XMY7_LAOST|nr:hypothetical protein LSTR_LSTR002561 [Laodelphax striatellus]
MMWKQFILNKKLYLLRNSNDNGRFQIFITDLLSLWTEDLSEEELLQRCKDMNPLHEASSEILIQRINELVELNSSEVKTTLTENKNEQLELGVSSYLKGVIFKIKFLLSLGSPEMFFKQMTSPLIRMVEELQERQNKLFDLLNKKDIEIDEYKMGGMKITRKNIETTPFCKEEFLKSFSNEHVEMPRKSICPITSFINNCNELYEECSKSIETAVETEEKIPEENLTTGLDSKTDKESTSPRKAKSKRGTGIVYEQGSDEDDETYFSIPNQAASTTSVKKEKSPTKKKRSRIQDMF